MCLGGGSSTTTYENQDLRTAQEKQRDINKAQADEQQLNKFRGYQGQEDLGYAESGRGEAISQPFDRVIGDLPEEYANIYASSGFGPKRVGPQAAGLGRETAELRTRQSEQEAASVANWRDYVRTFGNTQLSVGGPQIAQKSATTEKSGGGIGGALGNLIGTFIPEVIGGFSGGGGSQVKAGDTFGSLGRIGT